MRISHKLQQSQLLAYVLFVLLSVMPGFISGTVFVPEYNRSFPSMPALFGGRFSEEAPVSVHLQHVEERPMLCYEAADDTFWNSKTSWITNPSDDLPVALLVKRGDCTFWEKAQVAAELSSALGGLVQYVIIYDHEVSPLLVPMSADSSSKNDQPPSDYLSRMSLLFVSYHSGMELLDLIAEDRNGNFTNATATSSGEGPVVELDGISPPLPPPTGELNVTGYMLAALTGFLAFLIFFACVLICAQAGFITAHPDERGRIILFAGGAGTARNVALRMMANGLLTERQVQDLEEEEFEKNSLGEEEEACCCAICLEEFEDKEKVRVLPCQHRFHDSCLIPWLTERHSSCPLCKCDVLEHILSDGKEESGDPEPESSESETESSSTIWQHLRFWGGWTLIRGQESSGSSSDESETNEDPQPASEIEMGETPTT